MSQLSHHTTSHHLDFVTFMQTMIKLAKEKEFWLPEPSLGGSEGKPVYIFHFYDHDIEDPNWDLTPKAKNKELIKRFRAAAKGIGGKWEKNDPHQSSWDDTYYTFTQKRENGDKIVLFMERDTICERVQIKVEKQIVPAVKAKAAYEQLVPIFDRVCKPLFVHEEEELDAVMAEVNEGATE
jgi:hypothetical protein